MLGRAGDTYAGAPGGLGAPKRQAGRGPVPRAGALGEQRPQPRERAENADSWTPSRPTESKSRGWSPGVCVLRKPLKIQVGKPQPGNLALPSACQPGELPDRSLPRRGQWGCDFRAPFGEPRGGVPPERTPFPSHLSGSTPQLGPRGTGARNPGGRWRRTCHGQGGPGTEPQVRVGHGGAEAGSQPGSWHSGPKPRTLEAGWLSGVALESRPSPSGNKALHVSLRMRPLLRIKTQFYFIFFRLKRGAEQLFPHRTFQKPTQQGSHFGRGGHGPTRAQWWGRAGL